MPLPATCILSPPPLLPLQQILTSTGLMDYHSLNYLSLADVSVALVIACFLPSVSTSVYFHRQEYLPNTEGESGMQLNSYQKGSAGGDGWMVKFKKVRRGRG